MLYNTTDAVPVQKPLRCVSLVLQDKFKDELDHMESLGIISKLDKNTATPLLNSLVLVKKPNGSLRVCLDQTDLNNYIVCPFCNMHTLDEINYLLKDAKFFSVFDTTKGFFQVLLDADSCLLTAMITPFGIYIFNVMAMGLSQFRRFI